MRIDDIEPGHEYTVAGYYGHRWDPTDVHVRAEELITIEPTHTWQKRQRLWRVTWLDSKSEPLTDGRHRQTRLPSRDLTEPWEHYLERTAAERAQLAAQEAAVERLRPLLPERVEVSPRRGLPVVMIEVRLDDVDELVEVLLGEEGHGG